MKNDDANEKALSVRRLNLSVLVYQNLNNRTETLVHGETRAMRFLRGAMIVLLVTAPSTTGIFVNRLSVKSKVDAFTRDFDEASNHFIRTFTSAIASQLYNSYSLSYAIGTGLLSSAKPDFPYVAIKDMDNQVYTLNLQTRPQNIIWSPLLPTHKERKCWEAYATNFQRSTGSYNSQYPLSHICGESFDVANPNKMVSSRQCSVESQDGNPNKMVSSRQCSVESQDGELGLESCGCTKLVNSSAQPENGEQTVSKGIFRLKNGTAVRDDGPPPFSPVWQISPSVAGQNAIMFNQMSVPVRRRAIISMVKNKVPIVSKTIDPNFGRFYQRTQAQASPLGIVAVLFFPVFEPSTTEVVGSLAVDFSWKLLFELDISSTSEGVIIVLENTCSQVFSFKAAQDEVMFVGAGDLHDSSFDSLVAMSNFKHFNQLLASVAPHSQGQSSDWGCAYRIRVYPSNEMRSRYVRNEPWMASLVVVSIFLFTFFLFFLYDFISRRLQAKVLNSAERSEAIFSSLFPAVVRDRLYQNESQIRADSQFPAMASVRQQLPSWKSRGFLNPKALLLSYLSHPPESVDVVSGESEPIADLFLNTTVLFADIAGFTAWSSERDPAQVFKLLETLYGAFDQVANRLGIFKVETIGDCYVAVSGLPEPRLDHAVVMVEFASQCLRQMRQLTRTLESTLGPGTADLNIRVGLHSGPVTAGVLRVERARFQLFGDTVNTASRMESNGQVQRIHVSQETAQLLMEAGHSDWVEKRDELISVKGKGKMQTFWAKPKEANSAVSTVDGSLWCQHNNNSLWGTTNVEAELPRKATYCSNRKQLIEWNNEFLQRKTERKVTANCPRTCRLASSLCDTGKEAHRSTYVVDDITEVINMPEFINCIAMKEVDTAYCHQCCDFDRKF